MSSSYSLHVLLLLLLVGHAVFAQTVPPKCQNASGTWTSDRDYYVLDLSQDATSHITGTFEYRKYLYPDCPKWNVSGTFSNANGTFDILATNPSSDPRCALCPNQVRFIGTLNQYHRQAAYGCHAAAIWTDLGGVPQTVSRTCVAPPESQIGEMTNWDPANGWGDWTTPPRPTVASFDQTLQGPFDLGGRNVWEEDPGGSYHGNDTCWWRNSQVEKYESITPKISDPNDPGLTLGQWRVWGLSAWGRTGSDGIQITARIP